ncbi:MAG TPA: EF-hand domain-containing protein [Candidatus Sulfotelmatobacter sp.]|nr:EF-hand domain-containing protein [Candidatus Sulfotelmatobacter sp.]
MRPLIAAMALALAVPLALPLTAARAADTDQNPPRGFKTLDADGDGKISFDEYKTVSEKRIARFVARHPDGKLAAATPDQREVMIKARFDAIDANHDGAIDETEWANRPHGRPRAQQPS